MPLRLAPLYDPDDPVYLAGSVRYHGSRTAMHGEFVVESTCGQDETDLCAACDEAATLHYSLYRVHAEPRYVLVRADGAVLRHVRRRSFTVLP